MKKTILVTGSNKGIGLEIVRQLSRLGHHVILSGRDPGRVSQATDHLRNQGFHVEPLILDVNDPESIEHAAGTLMQQGLKLDVLINNAGIVFSDDRSLLQNDISLTEETIKSNAYGPLRVVMAFYTLMNSPGRIINVSSGGGSMTDPVGGWSPSYCISKTLLNAITRHLAFELRGRSISVNAVCPGWVRTDMGGKVAPRSVEKGAETPVWLAVEAPRELTGKMFGDKKQIPW